MRWDVEGDGCCKTTASLLPYSNGRCLFRVLDSFGTEPIYNFKLWKPYIIGDMGKTWGNWNLQPRQFMTMFREFLMVFYKCLRIDPTAANDSLFFFFFSV